MIQRIFYSLLLATCLMNTGLAQPGHAAPGEVLPEVHIPVSNSLAADARLAKDRALPIMVLFVASDCPYCVLLEEEFIKPMLRSGEYGNKVIIRQLDISTGADLEDFSGLQVSPASIANRHQVYVTPTILFLDANGKELVPRMIGINTIEFYGGYLDNAIDQALEIMRQRHLAGR